MKKIILLLVFLLSLSIVYGATNTLDRPAASGIVAGTYNLSVSLTTELNNLTFAWFYANSTSTGNSSLTFIVRVDASNVGNNSQHIDYTGFDSTTFDDCNDCIFTATAQNGTGSTGTNYTDTSTSVRIDNTAPETPTLASSVSDKTVYLSLTASSKQMTSCTATFSGNNPGSSSYRMTDNGNNNATASAIDYVAIGTYNWYATCTDKTNETSSSTSSFSVDSSGNRNSYGGYLVSQGAEAGVNPAELIIEKEDGILSGFDISLKIILMIIGIVIGLFFVAIPIPLPIPVYIKPIIFAVLLGALGYYLGGLI